MIPLIHGCDGSFSPHTFAHLKRLARDAAGVGARDGANYDGSWTATSFLSYHMQNIASAIVTENAEMMIGQIKKIKIRAALLRA